MKQLFIGMWIVVAFASFSAAQTNGQTTSSAVTENLAEVRRAIDKGNGLWIEGWEKGDAALIATAFAEDGVWLVGGGKVFKGRQQIAERLKPWMQSLGRGVKVTVTTVDVWLDGETAFETGKYVYKYQSKGKPVSDEGKYVAVWKRQKDGSWKLAMDMGVPLE
jgi:uncharacterized protein (TIGR02246 family)